MQRQALPCSTLQQAPDLFLLVPVLREQGRLVATLQRLAALPSTGTKRIVVVTTQREIAENQGEEHSTTVALAKTFIAAWSHQSPSLYEHIHYPNIRGNKASQLNYAFRELTRDREHLATCYIGVYDVDSCPATDTLLHLENLLAEEAYAGRSSPIAIQQPALFFENFNTLSWYLQMEALFQTRWVFGHEIRTMRASTRSSSFAPYAYCVGHGMFIRADFLARTGGFPEPSEDVPLGHRLNFLSLPIHPLPVYDLCEVVPRVSTLIRQSGFWFWNAPLIWREYAHVKQLQFPTRAFRSVYLLLQGMIDSFSWVHAPLHFLSLCFLLLYGISPWYAFLSVLVCYLDAGVGMLLMLALFPACSSLASGKSMSIHWRKQVWLVLCAPLRNLVRGVAPVMACWYLVQSLVLKQSNVWPKTMR